MSLFPVDRQDDDSDEDDGQTNENGDQEVHVQIQGNHGLDEFGIATWNSWIKKPFILKL